MNINLLSNPTRVSTPFVKVTIGDYTFGVFNQKYGVSKDEFGTYIYSTFQYPNYIDKLEITKINGQFNTYNLSINYPIPYGSDPNFFEKVFSSVSDSRKIVFSYGDLSAPKFLYKNEEAIITSITSSFSKDSSLISYSVSAISVGKLATASSFNFTTSEFVGKHQPSTIIKKLLKRNSTYGLQDIFTGMRNISKIESLGLIPSDDLAVELNSKTNINILDYIKYLVSNMRNNSTNSLYQINVFDDTSDQLSGCYFRILDVNKSSNSLDTYEIDIGYPSENIVQSFNVNDDQSYSILYKYNNKLNTNEYVSRIDDNGVENQLYSPNISSNNAQQLTFSNDVNWWKNVTSFPISASLVLKGVLRPTILMSKVKLNVLFYGKKHISSGIYLINKQVDTVSSSGCWTTLNLIRVNGVSQEVN